MRTRLFHRTCGGFGFDDVVAVTTQRFDCHSSGIRTVIDNQNVTILQSTFHHVG